MLISPWEGCFGAYYLDSLLGKETLEDMLVAHL